MFKRKVKREDGKLPDNALLVLKRAILKLPFDLNDSQIQALVRAAEFTTLDVTKRLVVKGSKSPGLYVVVSGRVEVISTDGSIALRAVKKGDIFEVVTDNVTTCVVTRKYMDTAKLFPEYAVTKELAYQCMRETPMFHNWSPDCLHFLVEQTLPEIIVLFPAGSCICRHGDNAREIFILVHGAAKLAANKQELVTVSANNASFCMGEEAFFNALKRNSDVRAETPCLVLIINKEHLDHLFYSDIQCLEEQELHESLSYKWKVVSDRKDKSVYSKYSGQLDLEVISILLWQAMQQRGHQIPFTAGFFHMLFLSMTAMEVDVGKEILGSHELYDVVVVLLKGCGELFSENQSAGNIQSVGLYLPSSDVPTGSWIKATQTSLIIKIPATAVKDAQEKFPNVVVL